MTRDNTEVTVPNAQMNSTQVINESAPVRRRRIRLNIGVAYDSDLATAEEAIVDAAYEEDVVLDTPVPKVRFLEFDDSAIVAQLQCHIARPSQRDEARHGLVQRIDKRFDDEDVKIPFPQREVTFFESGNEISIAEDDSDGRTQAFDQPARDSREFSN
nr:mechanosensitive ion channel domain-containing protein [Natronomonas pharaonis]